MPDLTADQLREMRDRADKATPGPWKSQNGDVVEDRIHWPEVACCYCGSDQAAMPVEPYPQSKVDATFIAAARTDLPLLLDAYESVMAERNNLAERCKRLEEALKFASGRIDIEHLLESKP